ncbi:hypothetical protein FB107DRAFT_271426 [Schizophyllum commune]
MLRAAPAETEEQPDAKARRRVQDLESDDGRAATEACLGCVDYLEPTRTLSISGHQAVQELNAASAPSTSTTPSISIGAAVGIGIGATEFEGVSGGRAGCATIYVDTCGAERKARAGEPKTTRGADITPFYPSPPPCSAAFLPLAATWWFSGSVVGGRPGLDCTDWTSTFDIREFYSIDVGPVFGVGVESVFGVDFEPASSVYAAVKSGCVAREPVHVAG